EIQALEQVTDRLATHGGGERLGTLLVNDRVVLFFSEQLAAGQVRGARIDDRVRLAVQDLLELFERHVQQGADTRRQRAQEPNVRNRRGQVDVAQPLATHLA